MLHGLRHGEFSIPPVTHTTDLILAGHAMKFATRSHPLGPLPTFARRKSSTFQSQLRCILDLVAKCRNPSMAAAYNIFHTLPDGTVMWRETILGLDHARHRVRQLAKAWRGEFVVIDTLTSEVVARVSQIPRQKRSSAPSTPPPPGGAMRGFPLVVMAQELQAHLVLRTRIEILRS